MAETKINNIKELTEDLVKSYESVRDGTMTLKTAKEVASVAGKILNSCKIKMEYNSYIKENNRIPFLDTPD